MINTLENTGNDVAQADRLVDNVYAIIDSKIQYLEYQQENLVSNCLFDKARTFPSAQSTNPFATESDSLLRQYERAQERMSKMSKSVRLLLLLRSNLIQHNAQIVLGLLTDGTYLRFSEEHLYQMLWISEKANGANYYRVT